MGFNRSEVDELLVACHRRCCLCHRFCGVKMELHHIEQRADGVQDDSIDNAIPLCFECHAEVQMYNDSHPRGRKFRPDELRAHKRQWLQLCKEQPALAFGIGEGQEKNTGETGPGTLGDAPSGSQAERRQDKNRQKDVQTLIELYYQIPRPFVDRLLSELAGEKIEYEYLEMLESVHETVFSTLFHCYDKELPRLFRAFLTEWDYLTLHAGDFYKEQEKWSGVAELILNEQSEAHSWDQYREYQQRVAEAAGAFVALDSYVRENYPEIIFEVTDSCAKQKCKRMIREERKEAMRRGPGISTTALRLAGRHSGTS
jgi:hypothetical protein